VKSKNSQSNFKSGILEEGHHIRVQAGAVDVRRAIAQDLPPRFVTSSNTIIIYEMSLAKCLALCPGF